ncbi:hypothetical protein P280DRAFT_518042 [Massarina eburnea CBS 473.64]|uniref:Uncharacterized protein n=1 Tax=Massarina eburnea CBS 473.64 TaxID=1395130 RepID=A0A6A6S353_9PLEO|nr:hypothetical protein P280DRAFT_518042 [Massarina eburnea CBS 473.64]
MEQNLKDYSLAPKDVIADDNELCPTPDLQTMYQDYADGFQTKASLETQLERGQGFIFAFLKHQYPAKQGFKVELANRTPLAEHGWDFWFAPKDYDPFPSFKKKRDLLADPMQPFLSNTKGKRPATPIYKPYSSKPQLHR